MNPPHTRGGGGEPNKWVRAAQELSTHTYSVKRMWAVDAGAEDGEDQN